MPGGKQQYRLFLVDPTQVKKVGLLPKRKVLVAVARKFIIGMKNSQAPGRKQCCKPLPVRSKKAGVYRVISHTNLSYLKPVKINNTHGVTSIYNHLNFNFVSQ